SQNTTGIQMTQIIEELKKGLEKGLETGVQDIRQRSAGIPNEPWTTPPGVHSPAHTYAEAASRGLTASGSHTKTLSSTETPGIIIKNTDKNEATETGL